MNALADRTTVAEVVTRLYTAAGRKATELELRVYAEVLAGVEADVAGEASMRMVAAEDWRWRPPSPALLLEYVRAVRTEQRNRAPAIASSTGPVASPERARVAAQEARARLSPRSTTETPAPRRIRATAHDLDDHQFCDHPPPEEAP